MSRLSPIRSLVTRIAWCRLMAAAPRAAIADGYDFTSAARNAAVSGRREGRHPFLPSFKTCQPLKSVVGRLWWRVPQQLFLRRLREPLALPAALKLFATLATPSGRTGLYGLVCSVSGAGWLFASAAPLARLTWISSLCLHGAPAPCSNCDRLFLALDRLRTRVPIVLAAARITALSRRDFVKQNRALFATHLGPVEAAGTHQRKPQMHRCLLLATLFPARHFCLAYDPPAQSSLIDRARSGLVHLISVGSTVEPSRAHITLNDAAPAASTRDIVQIGDGQDAVPLHVTVRTELIAAWAEKNCTTPSRRGSTHECQI